MQSKREFGFIVRVRGGRIDTAPDFLGTGMLVAPDWVLTCKHVVLEADPLGRLTDEPVCNIRVQSSEGTQIRARRPLTDPNWDLALLQLESGLTVDPPPLLWGITKAQESELRTCPLSAFGYTQVEHTGPLWQHQIKDLLLLSSYREASGTLTQIQLRGGIPAGCSGGPVLLPLGDSWAYAGTVYLGGEGSATSRVIMVDPVAEFLQQAGLHPTRIDATRALAVAPGELLNMEILIKRPESGLLLPNPYRGLAAFRELDAPYFHGREEQYDELLAAIENHPWVTMIGASGSGKSSLIFAGLVPRLRKSGRRQLASFRPKADPFGELATAITPLLYPDLDRLERRQRRNEVALKLNERSLSIADIAAILVEENPDQQLLLIADQFEEIYTQPISQERQRSFIEELLELVQASTDPPVCTLLISLRADFLGQALADGLLAGVLDTYPTKILGPMNETALRAAIENPAKQLGVVLEPGLTDRILQDLGDAPGTLPLLEFTLSRLWDRQIRTKLDHATYEAVGGVNQALADYADGILARHPDDKDRLRQIFIQLVRPGEGTEDTREVATREQVGKANWSLVKQLADARLVVTGRDEATGLETVEVVHEALIRHWRPIKQWVEQTRQFRVWQNRLRQAIEEWQEKQRDEGGLLRGARLIEAQERLKLHPDELTPAERHFIQESMALRERERISRRRLRRRITGGLIFGLLIALILGGLATWQWRMADRQRLVAEEQRRLAEKREQEAERQRQIAFARGLGAQALQMVGRAESSIVTERAAALALESWRRLQNADAYEAAADLCLILPYARIEHQNQVTRVAFSPDESLLVTGHSAAPMRLVATENGKVVTTINYRPGACRIAFNPNGRRFATTSLADRTVRLIATEDGRELACIKDGKKRSSKSGWLPAFAFSPNGRLLATAGADGVVGIIDVLQGTVRTRIKYRDPVLAVVFGPSSNLLTAVNADGTARLIDTGVGTEKARIKIGDRITHAVYSPDGLILATVGTDGILRLLTMPEGRKIAGFRYKGQAKVVAFSPDSSLIVMAGTDGTARLITTADGGELASIKHGGGYLAVAFSPDSSLIAVVSSGDRMVRLIATRDGLERGRFPQKIKANVAFSTDGRLLATIGSASTVRLVSTKNGREVARIPHDAEVHGVIFSPGGRLFATHAGGTVQLFSTADWNRAYIDHNYRVSRVAISPDNRLLATLSGKTMRLIAAETGREIVRINNAAQWSLLSALIFSPDNRLLAIGDGDKTVRLISTNDGRENCSIEHIRKVAAINFSSDGNLLNTVSQNGTMRRIDTKTGTARNRIPFDGPIIRAALSPDGGLLATESKKQIKLVEVSNGKEIISFDHHQKAWALAFSSDGTILAIYSDGIARLVNVMQGNEHTPIQFSSPEASFRPDLRLLATSRWNHFKKAGDLRLINAADNRELSRFVYSEKVTALNFKPDSPLLIIACQNSMRESGTIRFIDTRELKEIGRIKLGAVNTMALSPDGSMIAVGTRDAEARIWPTDPQKVFELLCHRNGRNLSLREWRDYGFDERWHPTCETWRNPTDVIKANLVPKPTAEECLKYAYTYWRICPDSKP